jgi:hypothetical protein
MTGSRVVPWVLEDDGRSVGRPLPGAVVGGLIALVPATAALVAFDSLFLALGVPAAFAAGALVAPAVRTNAIAEAVLAMAALTTLLGEATMVVAQPSDLPTPGSIETFALGLIFVGVPLAVVTVPCALAWALILQRIGSRG